MAELPPLQFAAVGLNHSHIYGMTRALLDAGAQLVSFFTQTDALAHPFAQAFPQAARRASVTEVLEDPEVALIVSAAVPCERAPLGLEAMRHGKDFLSDKPGFITPEQLAAVKQAHAETGRRYLVYFSERFESRATTKAGALVAEGAIGEVVHMIGLGPHQIGLFPRPAWFYDPSQNGGILTDLASHQIDQFLLFSASSGADLLSATVANRAHPAHASFRDVGDVTLQNGAASGFIRVDWLTPGGLGRWGDGRLFLVGTEGTLEVRKVIDVAGRAGGDHLFLVDRRESRYLNCQTDPLPFAGALVRDLHERSETAVTQQHVFTVSALAMRAQALAEQRLSSQQATLQQEGSCV